MLNRTLLILALCAIAAPVLPQDSRPVRIVVPWPPSGNVDITARTLQPALAEVLGQPVIVENRAGAGGRIGTEAVAKATPDGAMLLLGSSGTITAGPAVWKTVNFDPLKDFIAIGPIQSVPIVLTVAPKTPVSTYQEFVSLAKSRAGGVSIASAGNGSSNHLAIELLMRQAHLQLLHVPYKGSGPALTDLLGSQVDSMMDQLTASIGYIRDGRLRPLAISSLKRSPQLPEVPTLDELGVPNIHATFWHGIWVPKGTPPEVIARLDAAIVDALADRQVQQRFRDVDRKSVV